MIETLIVILLIGIATAVFSPFLFGVFRRERMRSVVREVYSTVLAARMQAVKRNTRVIVFFDLPNHRVISWAENAPFIFVYQADGTLFAPTATNSGLPVRPGSVTMAVPAGSANVKTGGGHARGVYISDPELNTFRISVDDFGSSGRASLLKFLPTADGGLGGELDYVPPPWKWTQ
jgi:type II secretory pathway pseudopilin PulG